MKLKFSTSFMVLPKDCNHRPGPKMMIFGGAAMSELDMAAYQCVYQFLQNSDTPCNEAATCEANQKFHKPVWAGDLVEVECEIVEIRPRTIAVDVKAICRPHEGKLPGSYLFATGRYIFVTMIDFDYANHGLTLPLGAASSLD